MKLPMLSAFTVLLVYNLAYAGGVDGGGGKSVVCRDSKGKVVSAEILDLFEGRAQYGFNYTESVVPMLDQAKATAMNLAAGRGANFQNDLKNSIDFVNANKRLLPNGTALLLVDDAANVIVPESCQIEQLANFTKQNQILLNSEIWSVLSETNKAALFVHEALYWEFRQYGATNSLRARKAVAAGFAGIVTQSVADVPKTRYECRSLPNADGSPFPGSHFYAFNDSSGELFFQLDYLDGELMLDRTSVMVDKIQLASLATGKIQESVYGTSAVSQLDHFTPVAVSFLKAGNTKTAPLVMKIGFGSAPSIGTRQFICAP